MKKTENPVLALLSSFGLSVVVILMLFVLTLLGTLHHGEWGMSLLDAQKKYFDSLFLIQHIGFVVV